MTFSDDLNKLLNEFAESNSKNRTFCNKWEEVRQSLIWPFFEQMAAALNARTDATGFSAKPKRENGSTMLEIFKKGWKGESPTGLINFSAEQCKIILRMKVGDFLQSEEFFDLEALDTFDVIEAKILAFVRRLFYPPADPMAAPSPPQRRRPDYPVNS